MEKVMDIVLMVVFAILLVIGGLFLSYMVGTLFQMSVTLAFISLCLTGLLIWYLSK